MEEKFLGKMFDKGAQKVAETVSSEQELVAVERGKIQGVSIQTLPPTKVAGTVQYSTMISFSCEGTSYMFGYSTVHEDKLNEFESLFK